MATELYCSKGHSLDIWAGGRLTVEDLKAIAKEAERDCPKCKEEHIVHKPRSVGWASLSFPCEMKRPCDGHCACWCKKPHI